MKSKLILAAITTALVMSGCGNASEEEQVVTAEPAVEEAAEETAPAVTAEAESKPEEAEEPGAAIVVTGGTQWDVETDSAQLTCQRAAMRNPFRAQFFDGPSKIGLTASGFPPEDGGEQTQPDAFRLTSLAGGEIANAELTDVALSVKEVSIDAGMITFEIEATGNIEGGGKFTASGTCKG